MGSSTGMYGALNSIPSPEPTVAESLVRRVNSLTAAIERLQKLHDSLPPADLNLSISEYNQKYGIQDYYS